MQHGALTPLGRQLRFVLLSLRSEAACSRSSILYHEGNSATNASSRSRFWRHHARHYASAAAAYADAIPVWPEEAQQLKEEPHGAKEHAQPSHRAVSENRRSYRRRKNDFITEALKGSHRTHVVPAAQSVKKRDLSHVNIRRRDALQRHRTRVIKRSNSDARPADNAEQLSLTRLLAKYIQHTNTASETPQPKPFFLSKREEAFLASKSYSLEDVRAWARILTAESSYQAATGLLDRITSGEHRSPPLQVLLYLLRRPYLSASALRQLLNAAHHIIDQIVSDGSHPHFPENAVMTLFVRLARHAREVWPSALEVIASLLIHALQVVCTNGSTSSLARISRLTYIGNTAMHLLSLPTGAQPFRDAEIQEAAIVRILRFMSEHEPPLQIDRQGYRAVVRIQLAQNKTPSEQKWAELKALSWPPWKQERTAMDADIVAEDHGTSRAAHTIQRMREAGYQPDIWQRVAQLYSGWDIDGTPTVQTRALMGPSMKQYRKDHPVWAARIATTRTAQEAWAAYLAYEDTGLRPNSEVIFAMMQKLVEEEKRSRALQHPPTTEQSARRRARLLPGDRREVDPLPPSVHLYTYTRTPIPTVETLFKQLHAKGVHLSAHTMALAVSNAGSLQLGIWYLSFGSGKDYSHPLLLQDPVHRLPEIPTPLLFAFIELLCRYSNVHMSKIMPDGPELSSASPVEPLLLQGHELNLQHPLVHAFELLRRIRPTSPIPWTALLRAMSNTSTLTSMRFFFLRRRCTPAGEDPKGVYTRAKCSMVALAFVKHILSTMREMHIGLTEAQLHYVCLAVENMVVACWRLAKYQAKTSLNPHLGAFKTDTLKEAKHAVDHALETADYTKELFDNLVGDSDSQPTTTPIDASPDEPALPTLLHCPSPVLLHAYIRALGWLGDHQGLLDLTRWMVAHQHELQVQGKRDRNAEDLMQLSVHALRVFLERTWFAGANIEPAEASAQAESDVVAQVDEDGLTRLESPAPAEIVEEVGRLVNSVEDWPSWPDEEEVAKYCRNERFKEMVKLYRV